MHVFFPFRRSLSCWRATSRIGLATIATLISLTAFGESSRRDTTSPNEFWFSSEVFYVDEDATSAEITVEFAPGDRSWSGSVDYTVTSGTATAGEDFTAVSGTLNFSGPGTPIPKIIIPISKDNLREENETVQISISNPNATIVQSNATLIIIEKPATPVLKIGGGANKRISLTWPEVFSDFVLEKSSAPFGTNWSAVSSTRNISNGVCCVEESTAGLPFFYRLRNPAAP